MDSSDITVVIDNFIFHYNLTPIILLGSMIVIVLIILCILVNKEIKKEGKK